MAFNFNRRINPVIPTTAVQVRNNAELVLVTRGFTGDRVTPKFVIQLDQAIPYGNTMPVVMSNVEMLLLCTIVMEITFVPTDCTGL